jgi:hypothetical protein
VTGVDGGDVGEDVSVGVPVAVSVDDGAVDAGVLGAVENVWVCVGVGETDADALVFVVVGMVFDGPGTAARLTAGLLLFAVETVTGDAELLALAFLLGLALIKLPVAPGAGVLAVVVTTGVAADGWTSLVRCGAASAVAVPATSSTPAAAPTTALRE